MNLSAIDPVSVQAISSVAGIFIGFVAIVVTFTLEYRRSRQKRREAYERETVALQTLYPEAHQLELFFLTTILSIDQHDHDHLKKVANGECDIDPCPPDSIADGRFEVVSALGTALAGNYSNALARRRSVIDSLKAVLNNSDYVAVEENAPLVDFQKAHRTLHIVETLCSQGVRACKKLVDEAERRDQELRSTGVKSNVPVGGRVPS